MLNGGVAAERPLPLTRHGGEPEVASRIRELPDWA